MTSSLAIVIPAYKPDFLDQTLSSLAKQTDKRFSVYIGNDASPFDLDSIVLKYQSEFPIKYYVFPNNIGGGDLVAHWRRCIQLVGDEHWICVFSDDDIMQPKVIESFYRSSIPNNIDVVHFDIDLIDEQDCVIQRCPGFPRLLDDASFFDALFRRKIVARMPEFFFRRSFLERKGLVKFDLAWRSDTATVLWAAQSGGIFTLSEGDNCKILWRASSKNISGKEILKTRKNRASVDFFNWVHAQGLRIKMTKFYLLKTIVFSLEYENIYYFLRDSFYALRKLHYAENNRMILLLLLLLCLYRIPYHWMEIHRK